MAFESPLSNLRDSSLKVLGAKKVTQIRVNPSSTVDTWDANTRMIQYFLPPKRVFIPARSGIADVVNVAATVAARSRVAFNPAVNSRWLGARLQIGGTEVLNVSNLNNGFSRIVRDACTPTEKFYANQRLSRNNNGALAPDDGPGAFPGIAGQACPSDQYPGGLITVLSAAVAAATPIASILTENRFIPSYALSSTVIRPCRSSNTPADFYVGPDLDICSFQHYTDFSDFYGTALCVPCGLPTGSGSVLEMIQDSNVKSFGTYAPAAAVDYPSLITVLAAAPAAPPAITLTGHYLKLTLLSNDGIENAEEEWFKANDGVEINMPYIDQINQSVAAGTTYGTNVTIPVSNRCVRAICSGLVTPGTTQSLAQCNGSDGSTLNMITAKATINGVAETSDILSLANTTLAQYVIANALEGSSLSDAAAYMSHPIYVSNFSGMMLSDLYRPQNVLCEAGKYFDGPLTYQLEGSCDAVARSCQFYLLSSKKAKLYRDGIVMA